MVHLLKDASVYRGVYLGARKLYFRGIFILLRCFMFEIISFMVPYRRVCTLKICKCIMHVNYLLL